MPKRRNRAAAVGGPLDWRPQNPGGSSVRSRARNPIIEPLWEGNHVLVHLDTARTGSHGGPWLRVIDEEGEDLTTDAGELVATIAEAVRAVDAVLDGWLTRQATRPGETVFGADGPKPIGLRQTLLGSGFARRRPLDLDGDDEPLGPLAFIAVDLLRIDGQDLFDVPLLERKRLLDSVLVEGDLVRATPFTQPPAEPWIRSWKAAGFGGIVLKGANSRYAQGSRTDEWQIVRARS